MPYHCLSLEQNVAACDEVSSIDWLPSSFKSWTDCRFEPTILLGDALCRRTLPLASWCLFVGLFSTLSLGNMSRVLSFLGICLFASVAELHLPGLDHTDSWNVSIESRNLGEWRLCERATLGMGYLSTPADYSRQTSLACRWQRRRNEVFWCMFLISRFLSNQVAVAA
jgi:hypothetical protein